MTIRRRFVPSFAALQAFDAAARHGSFARAADELNLTQGAISRQVRGLEEALGIRLFELIRQRVVLTDVGERYHLDVRRMLETLESSTLRAMSMAEGGDVVELATLPTFCSRWLIPKLPSFFAENPGVALNLTSRFFPFDFAAEPFDAAIHYGAAAWPGAVLHHLFSERMIAVSAPDFAARHDLGRDSALCATPLLQQSTRLSAWSEWFESAELVCDHPGRGARFDQISMLTQAACAGLGAALLPEFLIEDELERGALVRAARHVLDTGKSYYLVVPEEKTGLNSLNRLRSWMLREVARLRRREVSRPIAP